jgi:hypothetical protein
VSDCYTNRLLLRSSWASLGSNCMSGSGLGTGCSSDLVHYVTGLKVSQISEENVIMASLMREV